jgi:maleate isomerase
MYGKRGKIGLLITAVNTTLEADFHKLVPPDVSVHTTRMCATPLTSSVGAIEQLSEATDVIQRRARDLVVAGVGVILYGCTSGSFVKGLAGDKALQEAMTKSSGIPFVTTTSACVDAIRVLGLKSLAIATPYRHDINERLAAYLEAAGIMVVNIGGVEELDVAAHACHEPDEIFHMAFEADRPTADGLFISCTQLRGLDAAQPLEDRLGKPVVTANQASLWKSLALIGIPDRIAGYGRLLEMAR